MPYKNPTLSLHFANALCMALAKLDICTDSFEPSLVAIKSKPDI